MSQQNFSNGQTSLTVEDLQGLFQAENSAYHKAGIDWFTPFEIALPAYAKSYTGPYYKVANHASHPLAFSTEKSSNAWGKIYEEAIPSDCRDDGIISVQVYYGTNLQVPNANIIENQDEATWDMSAGNVLWRESGRKLRAFVPTTYGSATLKWGAGYHRLPTFPSAIEDVIDVPADDVATAIAAIKTEIRIP